VKSSAKPILRDWHVVALCCAALWVINAIWLLKDTRPPAWDMALHQIYALNYVPGFMAPEGWSFWEYSGNYPPLVHLFMAAVLTVFHPHPDIATLANLGATLVLFWAMRDQQPRRPDIDLPPFQGFALRIKLSPSACALG